MGLGPVHLVDLREARIRAQDVRRQLFDGEDPLAARHARRTVAARTLTFAEACDGFLAAHSAGWRSPKHGRQWTSTLATYALPVLGALPLQTIDTNLVVQVLEPIWTTIPDTSSRLRGRVEAILSWGSAKGYRSGDNPARWKNHLDHLLPSVGKVRTTKHHAALPYADVPRFVTKLRQQPGIAARALEFLVLTAVRTGDLIGHANRTDSPPMRWTDVDLEHKLWTIPRTKTGTSHRVPLSPAALAVLDQMQSLRDHTDIVFPGQRRGRSLSHTALQRILERMDYPATVHGFRSSFRTWARERTNVAREVAKAALAHVVESKVERAYARGDLFNERIKLMADWGAIASPAFAPMPPCCRCGGRNSCSRELTPDVVTRPTPQNL